MSETIPVSVILPVYNRQSSVARAIRTVLSQTAGVPELIVVDDGSTDETLEEVRRAAPRARLVRLDRRRGASAARNAGLEVASHALLAFQDSDDEWEDERLAEGLEALDRSGAGVAYSDMLRIRSDGSEEYLNAPPPPDGVLDPTGTRYAVTGIGIQTVTVRREALSAAGPFDAGLRALEDLELLVRLSLVTTLVRIPKPLVRYHETSLSISKDAAAQADARRKILLLHSGRIADKRFVARELREIAGLESQGGSSSPAEDS